MEEYLKIFHEAIKSRMIQATKTKCPCCGENIVIITAVKDLAKKKFISNVKLKVLFTMKFSELMEDENEVAMTITPERDKHV